MKTTALLFALLLLPFFAEAAPEDAVVPVEVADAPVWRVSAGYRVAPGIKTSARVDARAAARSAGAVLRPTGHGGSGRSTSTQALGSTSSGTPEAAAQAQSGYIPGQTRYEFDNGYVDFDDGVNNGVDTWNWHFGSIDDFEDGAVSAKHAYSGTTTTRSRTTESETTRTSSFRESYADDLADISTEIAHGIELRLDLELWQDPRFGVDVGIGWAWYDDLDAFSIAGRAYSASSSTRAETRSRSTETETSIAESGTVVTKLSQPEFSDLDDIRNGDGSIGGAYVEGGAPLQPGYQIPPLTITPDRFSTETRRDSSTTETRTTPGGTRTFTSSRSASRTMDVRSEGTLSLQELRLGVQPYWKATDRLAIRADVGVLVTYAELDIDTRISVNGATAAAIHTGKDEWLASGYAGLSIAFALTGRLELFAGADARFPDRKVRFDDGVVSGKLKLSGWSANIGLGYRF